MRGKQVLPMVVATLMLLNGLLNIVWGFFPSVYNSHHTIKTLESIGLVSYAPYQKVSLVLTIMVGMLLITTAIGLYRKRRKAWRWAIVLLVFLNVDNIYPLVQETPLILGVISLIILILFQRQFVRFAGYMKSHVMVAWVSFLFAIAYGSIGSYLMRTQFKGLHNFVDAIYYTFVTYSTVGYGDITPQTTNARIFVVTMIIVGIGAFATIVTVLLGPMMTRRLRKVFMMVENLSHLQRHAVICGVNYMTLQIANDLKSRGVEVLFIDTDTALLNTVDQAGFEILQGDAADLQVLQYARLNHANYLICGDDDDATNILVTMTARRLLNAARGKHKAKIIAKIDKPDNVVNATQSGADETIVPALLSSHKVLTMLDGGRL